MRSLSLSLSQSEVVDDEFLAGAVAAWWPPPFLPLLHSGKYWQKKPCNNLLGLLLSSVLVLGWKSIAERLSGYDIYTMDTSKK